MARAITPLCWFLLVVALAVAHGQAAGRGKVAVQYEDGQAQQVVEALTRRGYTVSSHVPEAHALFLDPTAAQQASALSAAGAAAPFKQGLSGIPGIASVVPVGFIRPSTVITETDETSPTPSSLGPPASATAASDIVAATNNAAETTASSAPPPSPPPPPPLATQNCPAALTRSSGHGWESIPWGIDRVQATDQVMLNVSKTMLDNVLFCTIGAGLDPSQAVEWPPKMSGCMPSFSGEPSSCRWAWNATGLSNFNPFMGILAARWNGQGVVGAVPFDDTAIYHINLYGPGERRSSVEDGVRAVSGCVAELDRRKASNRKLRLVVLTDFDVDFTPASVLWDALAANLTARGDVLWFSPVGYTSSAWPPKDVVTVASTNISDGRPPWALWVKLNNVELAAPGTDLAILAVSPNPPSDTWLGISLTAERPGNDGLPPTLDQFRAKPAGRAPRATATGRLVDCGRGQDRCTGAARAICLIQDDFVGSPKEPCQHLANCAAGGGIGAIISERLRPNVTGCYPIVLSVRTCSIKMPTISIAATDAVALAAAVGRGPVSASITFARPPLLLRLDGGNTVAACLAAAAAGLVWSAFPTCPAARIRSALQASAKHLGAPGRDTYFGYGLVQARAAYDYLKAHPC